VTLTASVINAAITAQLLEWFGQPAPQLASWPGDEVAVTVLVR